ncbi:MAG: hypothetical protein Q9169_002143 [Polycauliona sp. 2 TL-2023]
MTFESMTRREIFNKHDSLVNHSSLRDVFGEDSKLVKAEKVFRKSTGFVEEFWTDCDQDLRDIDFLERFGVNTGDVSSHLWSFSQNYVPDLVKQCIYDAEAFKQLFIALSRHNDKGVVARTLEDLGKLKKTETRSRSAKKHSELSQRPHTTTEKEEEVLPLREPEKPPVKADDPWVRDGAKPPTEPDESQPL